MDIWTLWYSVSNSISAFIKNEADWLPSVHPATGMQSIQRDPRHLVLFYVITNYRSPSSYSTPLNSLCSHSWAHHLFSTLWSSHHMYTNERVDHLILYVYLAILKYEVKDSSFPAMIIMWRAYVQMKGLTIQYFVYPAVVKYKFKEKQVY